MFRSVAAAEISAAATPFLKLVFNQMSVYTVESKFHTIKFDDHGNSMTGSYEIIFVRGDPAPSKDSGFIGFIESVNLDEDRDAKLLETYRENFSKMLCIVATSITRAFHKGEVDDILMAAGFALDALTDRAITNSHHARSMN